MKNFLKSASAFVLMLGAAVMLFTACDKKGGNSGGNGDVLSGFFCLFLGL